MIFFRGLFTTWEEALSSSSGYDNEEILEKVLTSVLKVKNGQAAYERDSITFDQPQYVWPLATALMWAAARNQGCLNVLDFGGSLGSSFFQHRQFLEGLSNVNWSVVEQAHFVQAGREFVQDSHLTFYESIEECLITQKPNVVLLSSVLQYLENPFTILDKLIDSGADIIVLDRTPFHNGDTDLITIQHVPPSIYNATYPMWIFSRDKFLSHISKKIRLISFCLNSEGCVFIGRNRFCFNGFLFCSNTY